MKNLGNLLILKILFGQGLYGNNIKSCRKVNDIQAIEFEASTQNGIVRIPEIYRNWYNQTIRVILLHEPRTKSADNASDKQELMNFFNRFNADLSSYRFDRDEANER